MYLHNRDPNKHTPNYNKSTDFSTSYSSPGGWIDKQYSPYKINEELSQYYNIANEKVKHCSWVLWLFVYCSTSKPDWAHIRLPNPPRQRYIQLIV